MTESNVGLDAEFIICN